MWLWRMTSTEANWNKWWRRLECLEMRAGWEKSYNPYIHPHRNNYKKFIISHTSTIYHIHHRKTITTPTKNTILINCFIKVLPHLFSKLLLCFCVLLWSYIIVILAHWLITNRTLEHQLLSQIDISRDAVWFKPVHSAVSELQAVLHHCRYTVVAICDLPTDMVIVLICLNVRRFAFHRPWPFLLIPLSNYDNTSTAQWLPQL